MKARARMAAIPDDLSGEEMIAAARKHKHNRLPVYDETPDTIVGALNVRSFLLEPDADLSEVFEFPSFVPESMNLLQLLKSLQRQQRGLAIVLDEYGGTAGVVTMQDILEQMVGEIRGEGESEGFVMEKLGPGKWRVNGTMRLDDFCREYPALGEVAEVDTMGGLMVAQKEIVPGAGESVAFRGLEIDGDGDGRTAGKGINRGGGQKMNAKQEVKRPRANAPPLPCPLLSTAWKRGRKLSWTCNPG